MKRRFSYTYGSDLFLLTYLQDTLGYTSGLYLKYLPSQFRGQFKMIRQITLIRQRYSFDTFLWSLHIKYIKFRVIPGSQTSDLTNHLAGSFLMATDTRKKLLMTDSRI